MQIEEQFLCRHLKCVHMMYYMALRSEQGANLGAMKAPAQIHRRLHDAKQPEQRHEAA